MCLLFRNRPIEFKHWEADYWDHTVQEILKVWFPDIQIDAGYQPSASISFMNQALVVPNWREGHLRATPFSFGIIPSWSKDGKTNPNWANSRTDNVVDSRLYSSLLKKKRCLIPVTGHYEFKKDERGKSQAYLVTILDQAYYALAGIWSTWKSPDGSYINTFAIMTSEPNEFLAQVHDRMPVILPREHWDLWLEQGEEDPNALVEVLKPYPPDNMAYWPMDRYVNNLVKNKEDALIVPSGDMVTA